MDKDQLEALVEAVVQRTTPLAVSETLVRFGIDSGNPIEVQKDLAFLREHRGHVESDDYKADMQHLRSWRNIWETVKSNSLIGFVAIAVSSVAAYFGFKS